MNATSFDGEERKRKTFPKFYKRWKLYFTNILIIQLIWIVLMVISLKDATKLKMSFVQMDKYETVDYEKELKQNEPLMIAICCLISAGQLFGWVGILKSNLLLLSIFNRICVTSTVAIACKIIVHYQNPVNYIELLLSILVLVITRKFITKVKMIEIFYSSKM